MQEWKIAYVNNREVPVLISDEKEALLAAKAAGRAIVGLWRPEQAMDEISAAKYVVENVDDATEEYLERVARRHLGWPWRICETERLVIREMFADDLMKCGPIRSDWGSARWKSWRPTRKINIPFMNLVSGHWWKKNPEN